MTGHKTHVPPAARCRPDHPDGSAAQLRPGGQARQGGGPDRAGQAAPAAAEPDGELTDGSLVVDLDGNIVAAPASRVTQAQAHGSLRHIRRRDVEQDVCDDGTLQREPRSRARQLAH